MWDIKGDFEPEGVGPIDEVGVDCGPVRAVSTTRWGLALVGRVEASSTSVISGSMSLAYVVERRVGGHRLDHSQITFCDLPRAIPLCRFLWLLRGVGRCGYTFHKHSATFVVLKVKKVFNITNVR